MLRAGERESGRAGDKATSPAHPLTRSPAPGLPVAAAVAAALAAVPALTSRPDLLNLLLLVLLYATLGQSWNILAGFAGQINLGHAAFFGIGSQVTRTLWLEGYPFPLALLVGGLAAVAFALLIGLPTFRLRGVYFSLGTLALAEALRITVSNSLPKLTTLTTEEIATYDLGARYELALALAVLTTLVAWLLLRSRLGLGLLAVREDEEAAQATGVNALKHKLLALGLSSLLAGLAGGLFAFQQVSYYPENPFGPNWTFDSLLITFIGGVGTLIGPLIGALFFILVREQLALALPKVHQVIFGALFILVVLALPGGLVDLWARLRRRK
jgi:branched-chain amino acid transport system permease protein